MGLGVLKLGSQYYFKSANDYDFGLFRGELTGEVRYVKEMDEYLYTFAHVERIIKGEEDSYEYGTFRAFGNMIFPSYEQLESTLKQQHEEKVQRYYDSIKTLHDLMKFPLKHCIGCAEEYTDWIAREAYIKRANDFGLVYKE